MDHYVAIEKHDFEEFLKMKGKCSRHVVNW